MYLKSLSLQGFKSFATKTELTFFPGISAVVGPNGSGKSNITDAIRWVLGEQSVRALRGARLQDVIFSGSESRRAVGMAEVTLVLDNTAGKLPLDFTEVTVTRRVFRSGESEFYINRTQCRLRDIQALFLDSGIGKGSFSLISQGDVDGVLSASPDERRLLLEDVAGITRYRTRKEEALEKLNETSENLVRIHDVITEVGERLPPLREAAEKAQLHQTLAKQLDWLEISLHGHEWARLDKQRKTEKEKHEDAGRAVKRTEAELEQLERERATGEKALDAAVQAAEQQREALQKLREQEQASIHAVELGAERLAQLKRDVQRSEQRAKEAEEQRISLQAQLDAAGKQRKVFSEQKEQAAVTVQQVEAQVTAVNKKFAESSQRAEMLRSELSQAERNAARWEGELESRRQAGESRDQQRERLQEERRRHQKLLEEAKATEKQVSESLANLQAELKASRQELGDRSSRLQKQVSYEQQVQEKLAACHRRYNEVESRRRVLADMADSYEGYFQGVRNILAVKEQFGSGLLGSVGELITVSEELELALETALGNAVQNVVTKTDGEAEAAIRYLKQNRAGRATFLPLESLRYRVFSAEEKRQLAQPGVIGIASELIDFGPQVKPAVDYLLGRTILTKDLRSALRISKQIRSFQRIVSLEGDVVSPGGAMTGGSSGRRSSGLLARGRELADLQEKAENLAVEGQELQGTLESIVAEIARAKSSQEGIVKKAHGLELKIAATERDLIAAQNELTGATKREAELEAEEKALGEEDRTVQEQLAAAQRQVAASEEAQKKLGVALKEGEAAIKILAEQRNALHEQLAEVRVKLAESRQQEDAAARDVARLQQATNEAQSQEKEALITAESAGSDHEETAKEIEVARRKAASARSAATAKAEELQKARAAIAAHRDQLSLKTEKEKQARQEKEKAVQLLHRSEVALERLEGAIAGIEQRVAERGATLVQPEDSFSPSSARSEIKEIRQQLAEIGPVNPAAIKELGEVEERYAFLTAQRDDLQGAKTSLEETIAEIDQTSTKRLRATYTEVNAAFEKVFKQLFGGGQASLEWTDESQPLEAGLEIMAQPPGKRLQSLMALSGGERALTATAFLFAMLEARPSPFCVLDEIDAALDEQNVARFSGLLTTFARDTQFIVITHRQPTMEAADTLYGVSMDRSASSKLVSLRLPPREEAEAMGDSSSERRD